MFETVSPFLQRLNNNVLLLYTWCLITAALVPRVKRTKSGLNTIYRGKIVIVTKCNGQSKEKNGRGLKSHHTIVLKKLQFIYISLTWPKQSCFVQ